VQQSTLVSGLSPVLGSETAVNDKTGLRPASDVVLVLQLWSWFYTGWSKKVIPPF